MKITTGYNSPNSLIRHEKQKFINFGKLGPVNVNNYYFLKTYLDFGERFKLSNISGLALINRPDLNRINGPREKFHQMKQE